MIKAITEKGRERTGDDEVVDLGISGVAKRKLSETPKSTRTQRKKRRTDTHDLEQELPEESQTDEPTDVSYSV